MRGSWRRWLPGRKHGVARGVGVFGPPGSDGPDQLLQLLSQCAQLRAWATDHGLTLADEPESLSVLDRHLDAAEPQIRALLGNEFGCYVGTVIVKHVPGARWRVWPNGHSVVQLPTGEDLDVVAQADRRLSDRRGTLASIYADVAR